jgi:glycosyltransferase involved in cell wall biosynthesis
MTNKPKVLMVTGTFLPRLNGAVLQCVGIIQRLTPQIYFEVLTGRDAQSPRESSKITQAATLRIHRLISGHSVTAKIRSTIEVARLLTNERFDIVHFHGFSSKALMIGPMAKLLGAKIVLKCTSVGIDDAESIANKGLVCRWFLSIVDAWICPSPALMVFCQRAHLPRERLFSIPNFVDTDRFRPGTQHERMTCRARLKLAPSDLAVLFVGHFSRDKQPHFLFEAVADILVSNRSIHLVMVGETSPEYFEIDYELVEMIRGRAAALGVQDQLIWISRHERMEEIFQAADIFALPSIREGMPNALAEAMASGLASVALCLPGVTDWMLDSGNCGQLVPLAADALEFSKSISMLLDDAQSRVTFGRRARQRCCEEFSPKYVGERISGLYNRLTQSRMGSRGHSNPPAS